MTLDFENIRTVEDTIDRMVLSVMEPNHKDSYMSSCYANICYALRTEETFLPDDEIVFLGINAISNTQHAVLVRDGEIIIDSLNAARTFDGSSYQTQPTKGVHAIEMCVKGRINLKDLGKKCMTYYPAGNKPAARSLENT